jgi:hypothetical protein
MIYDYRTSSKAMPRREKGACSSYEHATLDADARVRLAALESLSAFTGRPVAVESFERLCLHPVPAIAALARRCLRTA